MFPLDGDIWKALSLDLFVDDEKIIEHPNVSRAHRHPCLGLPLRNLKCPILRYGKYHQTEVHVQAGLDSENGGVPCLHLARDLVASALAERHFSRVALPRHVHDHLFRHAIELVRAQVELPLEAE